MDLAQGLDFLRSNHRAVLATVRSDGTPQLSPIVAAVDDGGRVCISTREPSMKVRNVRRDPRVWLCAFTDDFFGDWVRLDGRATVVPLPEAMDGLVSLYRSVAGEHPDWDDYRAAMERERRVLLVIEVERVGPDRAG
ncbi:MAG TPA: PPOX class F420-dependent oxidoreductase [Acidimicrobiales bacterium]|nr:PPOX class F420-dependent oxidoreductase [Acidimicrobiales bacterium]